MASKIGTSQNPVLSQSGQPAKPSTPIVVKSAASFTVLAEESGCTYVLPAAGVARVITLPPVTDAAGCSWRFVMAAAAGSTWTVTSPSAVLKGTIILDGGIAPTQVSTIQFTADALAGDWIEVSSSGALYLARGSSSHAGGIA